MEPEKIVEQWNVCTEKYGTALENFQNYLTQARELEQQLDSMLDVYGQLPERAVVNKKLNEYAVLMSKITTIDEELESLYARCVLVLDAAFKASVELRMPRLMMSFAAAKRQLADSLFDAR